MSYRSSSRVFLAVLVLAILAALPQLDAAITLTDTGTVWTNNIDDTPISNPLTVSASANVLVVDLSWRTTVGTTPANPPVVTYAGIPLTAGASALSPNNPATGANWTETAVYYLCLPPTGTSNQLTATFPTGGLTTYAVDAFSLGGVDITQLPNAVAGWNSASFWEGSGSTAPSAQNTIQATVNNVLPGSCAVSSGVYRTTNGQPTSFVTTTTNGSLNTSGPIVLNPSTTSSTGNFWAQNTSDCLDYGALVQNITSGSLTITTTADALSARMNMAVAVFAPTAPGYSWAGATDANWNTSTANWTGLAGQGSTYTNGFPAIFTDAGTKTNITIAGTIQPSKVWFDNFAVPYTFSGAAIAGSASVTLAGTGSVTFNSANTYSGGTTIYSGSLTAGANNALGTGPVNVNGGLLVISGSNAYAGGTTVNGGSVTAGVNNALGTGPVTVNGGSVTANTDRALGSGLVSVATGATVNFPSANPSLNGLSDGAVPGSGGSIVLGNSTIPAATNLTVISNAPTTFSGVISDMSATSATAAGSLIKAGSSTLTLAGNSSYTGGTTVAAGTLVASAASLGSGPLHITNGGTFSPVAAIGMNAQYFGPNIANFNSMTSSSLVDFNTVYLAGARGALTNNITANVVNGAKGNFDFDTIGEGALFPGQFAYGAPLNAGGTVPGTQVVNWAASYTGYFYAPTAGTYTFGLNSDDNSRLWIDGSTNDTAVVTNGTTTGGQGEAAYGVVQALGTQYLTAGYHQITIGYDEGGGGFGLQAFVASPSGSLTAGQAGTFLPVSQLYAASPAYSNPLLVDGNAVLALTSAFAYSFPSLTIGTSGASTLHVTGSGAGVTISGPTTLAGHATFNVDAGVNVALGAIGGNGVGLTKAGAGTLLLTAANSDTGGMIVSGGKLILGPAASLADGPITVNAGGVFAPQPADGTTILAGNANASLSVASGGAFDMSGDSAAGIFQVNGNAAGRSLTLGGGTLGFDVGSSSSVPADELLISGGSAAVSGVNVISITALPALAPGGYTLIADPAGGLTGNFVLSSSGVIIGNERYPLTLVNSSTAESVRVGAPVTAYTFNWRAPASGNGLWTNAANWDDNVVPGAGDVPVFSGSGATMTSVDLGAGNVTVAGLVFNKNLNNVNISATTNSAAQLILDNASNPATVTVGGTHTISAGVQLNSSVQITTTTSADQLTISGAISDNGTGQSLTKAGAGKLLLTGALNYSGPTYLTAGTLAINAPVSGMNEGLVSITIGNPEDITSPIPQGSLQKVARWGASTNTVNSAGPPNLDPSSSNPLKWTNNTTIGYSGFIDNTSKAPITYTFGKNFDDCAYLSIDGNVVINDNTYTTVQTYQITLSPGLHSMDLRFGQGGGGAGPTGNYFNHFGIAYNTVGNTVATGTWNQMGTSDSDTAFYAPVTGAPNTSVVMSSGTTLDLSGTSAFGNIVVLGSLAEASGSPTGHRVLLGTNTLETGLDNTDSSFSGAISGSGGLIKAGAGNFTLAGASTYTGPTAVNSGSLFLTGSATLASSPSITIGSGATLDATGLAAGLTRTANQSLNGGGTLNGNLTATGATITPLAGGSLTVTGTTVLNSGTILNLGIGDGTKQLLSVGGKLTANGTVTVQSPLLGYSVTPGGTYPVIQYSGSLGGASSLKIASVIFRGETIDTTSLPGTVLVDVGTPASLIWAPSAGNSLWNVNSTKNWNNSGTQDMFYQMDTVTFDDTGVAVNGGTVTLVGNLAPSGTAGYAGSAAPPTTMAVTVNTSGTYTFTGTGSIVGATSLSMSGGGTLQIANTNSFGGIDSSGNPYGVVSIHQGTINVLSGGILTNNTTEIDVGDTPGQTGTLLMSGGTALLPLGANGNSGVNVGINGGTGILTMTGNSLLDATCYNGFYNVIAIGYNNGATGTSGTATVGGTSTLRAANGQIQVGFGGTGVLTIQDQATVATGTFDLGTSGGTGTLYLNGGTLSVPAVTTDNTAGSTGAIYFNGGTLQATAASTNFIVSGGTNATLTAYVQKGGAKIDSNGYAITVTQDILHDPALGSAVDGGLTKLGAGTLVLASTSNSYTGVTNVTAGTLQLGAAANLSANDVNISAGATLNLNDNIVTIGALNGPAAAMVLLGSSTSSPAVLSVGDNGDSGTYAGSISGIGGLSKVGAGTLILAGSDTYTGRTTVTAGELIVSNASALPDGSGLTVGAGGTFIFKSAVAGSPVASAGGAVAAVPEPGTLVLLAAALIAGFGMWRRRK